MGWPNRPSALSQGASLVLLVLITGSADGGARVDAMRERGRLTCGVMPRVAGFASVDAEGHYSGFEIDICRALSAALFGAPDRVMFVPIASVRELRQRRDIDVVARRLTWTMSREVDNNLLFGPVIFYDGAGFLVPAARQLNHPRDLGGEPICVRGASEAHEALLTYFAGAELDLAEKLFTSVSAAAEALFAGECAALAADVSELGAVRASRNHQSGRYVILSQMISKEPLSLLLRQDDMEWFLLVRWTIFALIEAEELDVSSANVERRLAGEDPELRGLLGPQTGAALGLADDWVANVIRSVGNYGEIFARHLGVDSRIGLERGLNDLYTRGGLMYAPPVR